MAYNKILVAIDFSNAAVSVVQRAIEQAKMNQASLTVLHVVEYMPPLDFAGDPMSISTTDIDENLLLENATRSLQQFVDETLEGIAITQLVCSGLPKLEIQRVIDEQGMDLLVIGSHGRHGLARLLGSTAASVLNDCSCDVLAVRVKG